MGWAAVIASKSSLTLSVQAKALPSYPIKYSTWFAPKLLENVWTAVFYAGSFAGLTYFFTGGLVGIAT